MLNSDRDRTVIKGGGRAREMSYREAKKRTDVGGKVKGQICSRWKRRKGKKAEGNKEKNIKNNTKKYLIALVFCELSLEKILLKSNEQKQKNSGRQSSPWERLFSE